VMEPTGGPTQTTSEGATLNWTVAHSRPLGIIAWMQSSLARFEAGTNAAQPQLPETLEEQQRAAKCKNKI
jgi:hypothetical protein